MTFSIIGDWIEIDGLHVATLHRPLDYGHRDQLTEWLDLGANFDQEQERLEKEAYAEVERLEDEIGEAEGEAREANDRARAAEEEAEGYLEALKNIAFAAGKAGSVSGLDLERLLRHPGIPYSIYRILMDQIAKGQDAARKA